MISWRSVTYPRRPNTGITPPHRRWWWSRRSRPQGHVECDVTTPVRQYQHNDPAPQVQHLQSFVHIRWTMTPSGSRIPAEIAEVDRFESDLKFPQHDSVQWWSWPCSYASLRGATQEKERERRHMGEKERDVLNTWDLLRIFVLIFSPHGVPIYRWREEQPSIQLAMLGLKGDRCVPRAGHGLAGHPLGPIRSTPQALGAPHPYTIRGRVGLSGLLSGRSPLRWATFIN
jgi:hypothetical protein